MKVFPIVFNKIFDHCISLVVFAIVNVWKWFSEGLKLNLQNKRNYVPLSVVSNHTLNLMLKLILICG